MGSLAVVAFFKNGKRSVSALLISYFTFSHSVCQNFFCDVNVDILAAFAKEGSNGQERAGDVFSNESKTKKSVKRSIKEGESSGGLSSDDKSLTEGYLYLEKVKRGKTEDVKRGFIYLSSNGVEEGPRIEPFGKDASGKTHFTLKNAGSKYGENVEDSSEGSSENNILSLNLDSNKSGISSVDTRNIPALVDEGFNRKSKAGGLLKLPASKSIGANKVELLNLKVNKNKKSEDVSKENRPISTDSISGLSSTSNNSNNFKNSGSVGLTRDTADKKEFIEEARKPLKGKISSVDGLINDNDIDSLFSNIKEEKALSKDILASSVKTPSDLSKADSFSAVKENTKVSAEKESKSLVLDRFAPPTAGNAVSLNSEKDCSLSGCVDCTKKTGNEVVVGSIAETKVGKSVPKITENDSKNYISKGGITSVPNESGSILTLGPVENEDRLYKKCDNETCTLEQKNAEEELTHGVEKSVGESDILNNKNTLDEGSNSKGLVKKEFFNYENGKGEKVTGVSSIVTEPDKKDSILLAKKKVDTDDKDTEFLKGLVEEESWWSRWRKKLVLGMGALVTAAASIYGVKRWILKDGKGIKSTFHYF